MNCKVFLHEFYIDIIYVYYDYMFIFTIFISIIGLYNNFTNKKI